MSMPSVTPTQPPSSTAESVANTTLPMLNPRNPRTTTGSAAICARSQETETCREQELQRSVRAGPRVCFCQKENVLLPHHGQAYIADLPEASAFERLLGAILPRRKPFFSQPVRVEKTFEI